MMRLYRNWMLRRRLAVIVKQTRESYEVQDFIKRRAAALRSTRGAA